MTLFYTGLKYILHRMEYNMNIYIVEVWRDEVGFDGYYTGPFTEYSDAVESAKEECEKWEYTWIEGSRILGYHGNSREKLIGGIPRVGISAETIKNHLIGHVLKKVINNDT